jgi:hypothetical protein
VEIRKPCPIAVPKKEEAPSPGSDGRGGWA